MNDSLKQNLTQVLLIVFSVVLGLYLSERIEDRKNKKDSEKILANIEAELNSNIQILEEAVPYHREISQTLAELVNDEEFIRAFAKNKKLLFQRMLTQGSLMKQTPNSDAWEIAKANPLFANIEYEKLLILSKIYNQQHSTYEPVGDLVDLLLNMKPNDGNAKHNLEMVQSQFNEIFSRELGLLQYYEDAKSVLDIESIKAD